MIQLSCSVKNCVYNDSNMCCKENIQVAGSTARKSNETCCESFVERGEGRYTNQTMSPERDTNVLCHACHCKYNDNDKCHAKSIQIAGTAACCPGETECSTFTCGCCS